ncbi:rod shape-determining protein MreD [Bordetella sp. 02P26C-1]|nr:rod shape-determining protein MreD [Bordetella sp. 02P26C-1]MVW78617.1 rod shape-determining protein MreD [Bordetella sp. 02P26C-1]
MSLVLDPSLRRPSPVDRNNYSSVSRAPRRIGTPRNVPPEHLASSASVFVVWGTVLVAWLVSMLPWRVWEGAPDVLLMVIAFWCVHEPRRIGLTAAFCFGLLMDVHDVSVLGVHALSYTLVAYGAVALHRRLVHFDLLRQAIHMLPVFFVARLVQQIVTAWLAGSWPGWDWGISVLLMTAMWPVLGFVLHLPQRGADDVDSSAV